ncbi:nudC domain-containing protein 1 [Fopius arisanus]|uniref:NudC domain-containing protein 1 n=1 Tax=Fopius arisanus TaxID=64838 RepID=A0A9R1TLL4_9HYME|nr:PREDICTED: nudC domain-containing protein 1 [Fopius arisanus]XP_011311455.1 PREDICTED: nudC domain-containing protein 1 [Fopius arisanus]XP_011311456.1 PREDICTED: nudC domain-containing protein 1 [Fopius arisanus]
MPKIIELRPRKELLNNHFEKYQFSSEVIPVTEEINLPKKVIHRVPSPGQDSLLEARLFAFHNHLFQSPYDDSCWFVDEDDTLWCFQPDGTLHHVHSLPNSSPRSFNSTISFASEEIIVVSSGGSSLDVILPNNENPEQKVILTLKEIDSGVLMDAQHLQENNSLIILMSCIIEESNKKKSKIVVLNYSIENVESPKLSRRQELVVNGSVDYAYIESSGDSIVVLSGDPARFTQDSMKPVHESSEESSPGVKIPSHYWSQDEDSVIVWVKIPERHNNAQVVVDVTANSLRISVEDEVLIQGNCQFSIDPDTATWGKEANGFKVEVMKAAPGQMWSELIQGNTEGEHLPNERLAAEIHSRLSHLCTDASEVETGQPAIGFNADQLEECDLEGNQSYLQRINLEFHLTTHLAILGTNNRLLFTQHQRLCIRQDHDGCVWHLQEVPNDWQLNHESTFPGFGYVEASKSNKKFCISPGNGHYVVIVEDTRHAFIYERPGANARIARQKIVDLGPKALSIVGAVATNEYLILLTENQLYKLKV